MFIRSIRFKTTLLYSGILLAILLVYNVILFFSVRSILIREKDEQLRIKASEIVNILKTYEQLKSMSSHPMNVLEHLLQKHGILTDRAVIVDELWRSEFKTLKLKEDYINVLTKKGNVLIYSENVTPEIHNLIAGRFGFSGKRTYFGDINSGRLNLRAINMPFLYKKSLPLTIQVATPLDPVYGFLGKMLFISSVCIVLIITLTSFLGSFFVKRILAPVVSVTKAAENISHMDLGTRISERNTDIEMKQLITSFNAMIERLEKSFTHINEFNSHVAHELKTPLAIAKGELELAIEQAPEDDENRKLLTDCLEEVDRMIRITKDLLLLAKLDYNPQILKIEPVGLKAFLEEIREHGAMLAAGKQISVAADYPDKELMVDGDKVHLRRLFLNIIANAIRHTSRGGEVRLSAKAGKESVSIDIADTGEGISEEDMRRIFNKFFRVDKGEKSQEAGSGLGLSIALSVARAHRGDIQVKSKLNEGTVFTVTLPLSA